MNQGRSDFENFPSNTLTLLVYVRNFDMGLLIKPIDLLRKEINFERRAGTHSGGKMGRMGTEGA